MAELVVCVARDGVALRALHDNKLVASLRVPPPKSLVVHEEPPRALVQTIHFRSVLPVELLAVG